MKRFNYIIGAILGSGILLMGGLALSSEGIPTQDKGMSRATLTLEEAIATAKTKFPGEVLETELETEHGQAVYEIEIASTTGVVTEIKVDAQSGELLSSDIEDHEDAAQEKSEEHDKD